MKRAGRLRNRLLLIFLSASVPPVALTLWTSVDLLNRSLTLAPFRELDSASRSLATVGREYYQRECDALKAEASRRKATANFYAVSHRPSWPPEVESFWASRAPEAFEAAGDDGARLDYLMRDDSGVRVYSRKLEVPMKSLSRQYATARGIVETSRGRDLPRGFLLTLLAVCSIVWAAGFAALAFFAHRVSTPIARLTTALGAVASGDLSARVAVDREDETGEAMMAFNAMADQLEKSRDKLIHVTRLASWQALARKTAHEVKNSLTPIRLTMEEIIARHNSNDPEFLVQAAQIVIDEVNSLEKRVRAFSELAAEPPVSLQPIDLNGVIEERTSFLRAAHPDVIYDLHLAAGRPAAIADPDLVKAVFTNLFENAAEAAGAGGVVLVRSYLQSGYVMVEVHDSGPGLSQQAQTTLFEPTISFKKGGMGIGLSIARKSALLCGGDVEVIQSELGGAAFRVVLPQETGAEVQMPAAKSIAV